MSLYPIWDAYLKMKNKMIYYLSGLLYTHILFIKILHSNIYTLSYTCWKLLEFWKFNLQMTFQWLSTKKYQIIYKNTFKEFFTQKHFSQNVKFPLYHLYWNERDDLMRHQNNSGHELLNTESRANTFFNLLIKALYIGLQCYSQCRRLSHRTLWYVPNAITTDAISLLEK